MTPLHARILKNPARHSLQNQLTTKIALEYISAPCISALACLNIFRHLAINRSSSYVRLQCFVTSSPIFRKGLPASTVTSGTSTGMNSLRSGGILISMLSHSTLRKQARMELHVIRPSSILSAGEHCNISRKQKKGFTFIPSISEGGISRSISLKIINTNSLP